MRRAFALFLFLSAFAAGAFSQTRNKDKAQNRSLLTSAQQKQIDALRHDHNLWDCLKGFGCDYSALNELESKQVVEMKRLRNLLDCESALGICDKSLLTDSEKQKTATLEKELNLLRCKTGSGI